MMRFVCTILFLLFFTAAHAVNDTIIKTELNKIENPDVLANAMNKLRTVRSSTDSSFVIVHFGDSHIQADIFSGEIRNNLQEVFRYGGEGILFPYSVCKSFGPKHLTTTTLGEWTWATLLNNPDNHPIGITGYTLIAKDKKASITFVYNPQGAVQYRDTTLIEEVSIWHSANNFKLILNNPKGAMRIVYDSICLLNGFQRTRILNYRVGTELKLSFDASDTNGVFLFHGISFENPSAHGLNYHRGAVVGATFLQLVRQQDATINHLRQVNPDLLIFSYGSNESYDANFNVENYHTQVSAFIKKVKTEIPNINIIFTGTPDTRSNGRFPVNTVSINNTLRQIAIENDCAFWDLNAIMGGDNSIMYWLDNGLARKDKLHFTRSGYALQGNLFSSALMELYLEKYDHGISRFCDSLRKQIDKQLESLKTKPAPPPVVVGEQTHYVKKGETLSSIGRNYGVSVQQLCDWNNITTSSVLHIGQKIVIRK